VLIAVFAALAAGACFALAGVLQQQAASRRPESEAMSFRLLRGLAGRPLWLTGILLAVPAYGFQSLALAFGPLSLVQPLIVSELVFAIPLSARLYRMRLHAREWLGASAVTCGLVTAITAAHPHGGTPGASVGEWALTLTAAGVSTSAALLGSRGVRGPARASLIALAAGVVMGIQSVFLAVTIGHFREGFGAVFTGWQTYLLVAASIVGLVLIQSAFQAGPLSASMPVIDATEPAVAVTVGVVLFGESVRVGWLAGSVTAFGLALLLAGIVLLDTSPLLKALHHQAETERPDGGARRRDRGAGGRSGR
jgi:drug/metabolite transporter (DMT)-like permease